MGLGRLAFKNLQQRVFSPSFSSSSLLSKRVSSHNHRWSSNELLKRFSTSTNDDITAQGREVTVSDVSKKGGNVFPRRRKRSFVPSLHNFFPSGLGNALVQATQHMNKLLELPSQLIGRVKEEDECYKLRYEVPGLGKDEVKITVDQDGFLLIKGEHKEEEEEKDEFWSSYGYYNTSLMLPNDAKLDEIKAEMKDGVLSITIPRTHEKPNKDVKEIQVE